MVWKSGHADALGFERGAHVWSRRPAAGGCLVQLRIEQHREYTTALEWANHGTKQHNAADSGYDGRCDKVAGQSVARLERPKR